MPYDINELLKYQKLYEQEKQRIEKEESAANIQKIQRDYAYQIGIAKNAARVEKLKNDEVLKLQKIANSEYLESLEALAQQEKEIFDSLKKSAVDAYSAIADYASDTMGEVIKNQEKFEDRLSSYGNKFANYRVIGGGDNGEDISFSLLSDFSAANLKLKNYCNAIEQVKDRIKESGFDSLISSEFLSAISDMSIEDGTTFSRLLIGADDAKFKNYLSGWAENIRLSEQLSKELYSDEFASSVDKTAEYMKKQLEKIGFEVPEDFSLSGTLSAENFGQAFVDELDSQLESIRNMISDFNSSLSVSAPVASSEVSEKTAASITYNQNFNVGSEKESAYDQITAWKNAVNLSRLRGQ